MCGIAGHLSFTGHPDTDLVTRMSARLAHRGPDGEGSYADDHIALAHRRLAIIDLSPDGAQPMANEDGTLQIVYNGEIYNYIELREELREKGHVFRTKTDTEVILHAYEEWGNECLSRFNGMWAFALWDTLKKTLFCARDRFGIKPFYYTLNDDGFLFASEIKALLEHPGVGTTPEDPLLLTFLASGVSDHTGKTMFHGVSQIPPSHYLIVESDHLGKAVRYWNLTINNAYGSNGTDDASVARLFLEHLNRSVRLRLRSDVPVGTCLSGGIDSSTIVMLINRLIRNEAPRSVGDRQKTFSIVFPGTAFTEEQFVRVLTESSGVDASLHTPDPGNLWNDLRDLLIAQDEPFGSLSIYAQYEVMRIASRQVKVVLDGQGADELLGGYIAYQIPYLWGLLRSGSLAGFFTELTGTLRHHGGFFPGAAAQDRIRKRRQRLLKGRFNPVSRYAGTLDTVLHSELLETNLPVMLHWEDRNSMAFSIEARVPFLDFLLVEYTASLPLSQKIRGGITKYVLRSAVRGLIPDTIRCRKDKMGFVTPEEVWMKTVLSSSVREILSSPRFGSRPYWDADAVRKEYDKFLAGKTKYSPEFWRIVCTELWLREFFDRKS
jgi:asparagine synthase (glutamine-hydrolysing)